MSDPTLKNKKLTKRLELAGVLTSQDALAEIRRLNEKLEKADENR